MYGQSGLPSFNRQQNIGPSQVAPFLTPFPFLNTPINAANARQDLLQAQEQANLLQPQQPAPTNLLGQPASTNSTQTQAAPSRVENDQARPLEINRFDLADTSIPASVRSYNIAAIGARSDNAQDRFGAFDSIDLPASDGSTLSTPAFRTRAGGAAYYGHWVKNQATDEQGNTSIGQIIRAYGTGNPDDYLNYVSQSTGISPSEPININTSAGQDKLFDVMLAQGRWEAGATREGSPGFDSFNQTYDLSNPLVGDELLSGLYAGVTGGDLPDSATRMAPRFANGVTMSQLDDAPYDPLSSALEAPLASQVIQNATQVDVRPEQVAASQEVEQQIFSPQTRSSADADEPTRKRGFDFNPVSMGLLAFGLARLTGSSSAEAIQLGLGLYQTATEQERFKAETEAEKAKKEQQEAAFRRLFSNAPPELIANIQNLDPATQQIVLQQLAPQVLDPVNERRVTADLIDSNEIFSQLNGLENLYNEAVAAYPENAGPLTLQGDLIGIFDRFVDTFGAVNSETAQGLRKEAKDRLNSAAKDFLNRYVKFITGAQMSNPEAVRIAAVVPSADFAAGPQQFLNRLSQMKDFLYAQAARQQAVLDGNLTQQTFVDDEGNARSIYTDAATGQQVSFMDDETLANYARQGRAVQGIETAPANTTARPPQDRRDTINSILDDATRIE